MTAAGILVAGTSSDAGKSLVVAGLCRLFARRNVSVAPFKAQNMSNNSMVCADGSEIGRAQYLQAIAAGVEPSSVLNPVLLKPGTDRRSFIVLRGQPAGRLDAGEYATGRTRLAQAAYDAYAELAASVELIVVEGAGSPAEINLRAGDYVNFGLARRFGLPVVLVADIDRGGALAAVYGTWAISDPADRALLSGYLMNKFRGDVSVLEPGLDEVSARTGLRNYGVLPWLDDVWLDSEDSLAFAGWTSAAGTGATLEVAAVRFPRISNGTDLDALAAEPGVRVRPTASAADVAAADLVVLPGSRSTVADLAWLRSRGIDAALAARVRAGRPVLGICGGYQMLARSIDDPVESEGAVAGLGLLPTRVEFSPAKILGRPSGVWRGCEVTGYEIHHGVVRRDDEAPGDHDLERGDGVSGDAVGDVVPGAATSGGDVPGGATSRGDMRSGTVPGGDGVGVESFLDGVRVGPVWGTIWHGTMENDDFRRTWLRVVAAQAGSSWTPLAGTPGFAERRELMLNALADAIETHIDVDALLATARAGAGHVHG